MKSIVILFLSIFNMLGCACIDYNNRNHVPQEPDIGISFRIINHTNNDYKNNALYSLRPVYKKIIYGSGISDFKADTSKPGFIYSDRCHYQHRKIDIIKAKETIDSSSDGYGKLSLSYVSTYNNEDSYLWAEDGAANVLVLVLNSGKQKIFFAPHEYGVKSVEEYYQNDCTVEFIRWDIHPVWQIKNTEIHIYDNRIEIEKLNIINKVKLDSKDVELKTIPFVKLDESC